MYSRVLSLILRRSWIYATHGMFQHSRETGFPFTILSCNSISFAYDRTSLFCALFGNNCRIWVLLCSKCRFWVFVVWNFGIFDNFGRVSLLEWYHILERTSRLGRRFNLGSVSTHSAFNFEQWHEMGDFASIRYLHVFGTLAEDGQTNKIALF